MATTTGTFLAVRFDRQANLLRAIDQTALPFEERELELRSAADVVAAIKRLSIRGAPLIGVAGAYGLALELVRDPGSLDEAAELLKGARPTAVNLAYAIDRVAAVARSAEDPAGAALAEAAAVHAEEEAASDAIACNGADLLRGVTKVLTHCNTGALAAPGRGTALAVVAELHERGQLTKALATESRPLLQGARLTVYELQRLGIAHELVVDSAAAGLIAQHAADAVIVGCDRVAANGDVANKVGTYGLALAAHAAGIPFVVAGPTTTIDLACPDGGQITIEERAPDEVRNTLGTPTAPLGTSCRNPAFDVTPAKYVSALVTERGIAQPPTLQTIAALTHR
jgi:methylthioribose-1-phosphate isomerase